MRKRSGALEADSIETYLKLAIKTAQENIRFPKKSLNSYRNKSFYDYIIPSWSQEQESSYELALDPSGREDFSLTQSKIQEIQSPKQKSLKIMVLSQSHSEKKKFINAICPTHLTENEATNFDLNIANKKEPSPCLDLRIKYLDLEDGKKVSFKFWIQNLCNNKFDQIVNVHYRTAIHFIFIYDVAKQESFEKIKSNYEKIQHFVNKPISFVLIGLSFGEPIKKIIEEVNSFAKKKNCIGCFFLNDYNEKQKMNEILLCLLKENFLNK